jgi:hypothetical protein
VKTAAGEFARKMGDAAAAGFRKQRQQDYVPRLSKRLELLENTFVIPALNPKRKVFLWPRQEDLQEIDECIFGLAETLRKKKLLTHTEAIHLVDQKWPRLRLERRLRQLIEASLGHPAQSRPGVPGSVEHLLWIKKLAMGQGQRAELARRFIRDHQLLRSKQKKLSQIPWADYGEILLKHDGKKIVPQCPIPFVSSKTSCCARYLEMERDLLLYLHELNELELSQQKIGDRKPFLEWIERNDLRDSGLNARRLERRRKAARERQARWRKEIRRKKRDKIRGAASDIERASTNSRDIWHLWDAINSR